MPAQAENLGPQVHIGQTRGNNQAQGFRAMPRSSETSIHAPSLALGSAPFFQTPFPAVPIGNLLATQPLNCEVPKRWEPEAVTVIARIFPLPTALQGCPPMGAIGGRGSNHMAACHGVLRLSRIAPQASADH